MRPAHNRRRSIRLLRPARTNRAIRRRVVPALFRKFVSRQPVCPQRHLCRKGPTHCTLGAGHRARQKILPPRRRRGFASATMYSIGQSHPNRSRTCCFPVCPPGLWRSPVPTPAEFEPPPAIRWRTDGGSVAVQPAAYVDADPPAADDGRAASSAPSLSSSRVNPLRR